ncbi:MAG: RNA methyltransferase [Ferruginibacter sp.]|nr:RNA methyltransferase [Chitinophagaceae bacterium]
MLFKQKVKYIQTLGQKKFRQEEGVFIAEGPKLVKELLDTDTSSVKEIFAVKEWMDDNRFDGNAGRNLPIITEITASELQRISQLTTPNRVLAIVQQYDTGEIITVKDRITLALYNLQDPGNLGTIIRIADWFGIEQVVCSPDSADLYNPKVVQATMGSIARIKVHYRELEEWLAVQENVPVYAASLAGEDITAIKKIKEGILIIGNESKGISPALAALANFHITIPQKGKAESLNAAVATGIILSHIS